MADDAARIGALGDPGLHALLEDTGTAPALLLARPACSCADALDGLTPDRARP